MNRTDNLEHKALFTIPQASQNTAITTVKPLPEQKAITGDKQTDAYLWVLQVIKTNEPTYLPIAEEALTKLTITPKEAQKRYSDFLSQRVTNPFALVLNTFHMDDPQGYIDRAKQQIDKASKVRGIFSSYEAAFDKQPAEELMMSSELAEIYEPYYYWNAKERKEGCMYGDRVRIVEKKRKAKAKGFIRQLPEPHTLSDVIRELEYWDWLSTMRDTAYQELYGSNEYTSGEYIHDREDYLEEKLPTLKPVSRQEAIDVCQWLLNNERFECLTTLKPIIINLVGECDNA